ACRCGFPGPRPPLEPRHIKNLPPPRHDWHPCGGLYVAESAKACKGQIQPIRLVRYSYSSAIRLKPYFAKRSLMASTNRAWVVRSSCTASSLNCFAASGTTCAAINCRPCLPLPFIAVLGAATSVGDAAAIGALMPCFSGLKVNGLRLLIAFYLLRACSFASFCVCPFLCL